MMERIENECHRFLGAFLSPHLRDEVIGSALSALRITQRNVHWCKALQDAQVHLQLVLSDKYEDDPKAMDQSSLLPKSIRAPVLYHRVEADGKKGIYRTVTVRIVDDSLTVEELTTLPAPSCFSRVMFSTPEEVVQHLRIHYPNIVIPPPPQPPIKEMKRKKEKNQQEKKRVRAL